MNFWLVHFRFEEERGAPVDEKLGTLAAVTGSIDSTFTLKFSTLVVLWVLFRLRIASCSSCFVLERVQEFGKAGPRLQ
ncbi:hypothetical protein ACS0TY_011897 [Phlomoides rotata]